MRPIPGMQRLTGADILVAAVAIACAFTIAAAADAWLPHSPWLVWPVAVALTVAAIATVSYARKK